MAIQHPDKRVRRTKSNFHTALFELMNEKDFRKITITDIVQKADYNRGTFYAYYKNKEELIDEIIVDIFYEMAIAYRKPYVHKTEIDLATMSSESIVLFHHFQEYRSFYQLMLHPETPLNFQEKLTKKLEELFREDFHISYTEIDPEIDANLFSTYRTHGIIGLIINWMNGGFQETPAYMSSQLLRVMQFHTPKIQIRNQP